MATTLFDRVTELAKEVDPSFVEGQGSLPLIAFWYPYLGGDIWRQGAPCPIKPEMQVFLMFVQHDDEGNSETMHVYCVALAEKDSKGQPVPGFLRWILPYTVQEGVKTSYRGEVMGEERFCAEVRDELLAISDAAISADDMVGNLAGRVRALAEATDTAADAVLKEVAGVLAGASGEGDAPTSTT